MRLPVSCRFIAVCLCVVVVLAAGSVRAAEPKLLAREGKGALYDLDGHRVAVLAGSPKELGAQHGVLLKDDIQDLVKLVLAYCRASDSVRHDDFYAGTIEKAYATCEPFIPPRFLEEIDAMADAAGVPRKDARLANLFPELFHCSGFALAGKATQGGELFHGRILDYMTTIGLQKKAVTFIVLPEGRNAFVNVAYAGFNGSVTGMNEKQVAFGEMGGRGEGQWKGMPMSFLMRTGLEEAATLDDALRIFRDTPRTCEYYYVISDGKSRQAVGLKCTPDVFETVGLGEAHPLLPTPVPDTVLLSSDTRYAELVRRVQAGYGRFDPESAMALMKRPVAMDSNLHNVLFAPERLALWVANATDPGETKEFRACDQPYVYVDFRRFAQEARASGAAAATAVAAETRLPAVPETLQGKAHDSARPAIPPDASPDVNVLLDRFRIPPTAFEWQARLKLNTAAFAVYDLTYPSPLETEFPSNNTVHCEYYRGHGDAQRPAVIVLDILDGQLVVARLVATTLANAGMDALVVKLPLYSERRPADMDRRALEMRVFGVSAPEGAEGKGPIQMNFLELLVIQGVADIRRGAALLATLGRAPEGGIGICGTSLGGFVGALAAGVDGHFPRAVIVLAGGGLYDVITSGARESHRIREAFESRGYTEGKLREALKPIDPLTYAHRLKPCDLLIMNLTNDPLIPASSPKALAEATGRQVVWYEGNEHTALIKYVVDVLNRTTRHFRAPLPTGAGG